MARSTRGITQGGVRWKRVSRATSGWMAGTIWMAEAPVPIIGDALAAQVVVVVPAGGVEDLAGEGVEPRDVRDLRVGERAGRGDDDIGGQRSRCAVSIVPAQPLRVPASSARTSELKRMCGRSPKVSATCSR